MEITITETRKKIKVNEDGDFIIVDVGDQQFISDLLALIKD